MDKPSLTSHYT